MIGGRVTLHASLLLLACDAGEIAAAPTCDEGPVLAWENYGDGFFTEYCQGCHADAAPQRFGAPADVVFDQEGDVLNQLDDVVRVVLAEERMPPGGGISEEELGRLRRYLDCAE